ncbi:MAG: transcription antitermination factor NusB [Bacteroidota bacterium]
MLNRRHLRIKVLQALYAFFRSNNTDTKKCENELLLSFDKVHDLYIYFLLLLTEIFDFARQYIEQRKQKHLASEEDLAPNTKFIDNRFIKQLATNRELAKFVAEKKLNWSDERDLVKKIFLKIKNSDEYTSYIESTDDSYISDKDFIINIFKKHISDFPLLRQYLEEKNIYWVTDIKPVNKMIIKMIKSFTQHIYKILSPLFSQFQDSEEGRKFILTLFRKTILNEKKYEELIGGKARNWEAERIAVVDILLMKMAICEILEFPTIPVKVTLNEYIEISKHYSTPKSNIFINGILDKLIADFRKEKKIKKTGRGLLD